MKRRRNDKYILNGHGQPVPVHTLKEWADWFEQNDRSTRVVKQEWVGNVRISTVFLSLDHNFMRQGPPVLWETMTFSNAEKFKGLCTRCAGNREQAEAMHRAMVQKVISATKTKTKK